MKNDNHLVAFLQKSRSVMTLTNTKNVLRTKNQGNLDGFKFEKFGSDDKLPDEILTAVWENDFMPQLLHTEAAFLHGAGLGVYRRRIVPGTDQLPAKEIVEPVYDPAVEEWMKNIHLSDYWLKACIQFVTGANVYTGFNLNIAGQPVEMNIYDWSTVRAAMPCGVMCGTCAVVRAAICSRLKTAQSAVVSRAMALLPNWAI